MSKMRDLINIVTEGEVVPFDQAKRKPKQRVLPALHPHAEEIIASQGLLARDERMERNIGRVVRFKNYPQDWHGTVHKEPHKIVGVQKTYNGNLAYRTVPLSHPDSFGYVANPKEIEFVDGGGDVTELPK